jgi:hypothetical protein
VHSLIQNLTLRSWGRVCYGGAASTTDGHFIAFGNTEETLRAIVMGQTEHGVKSEGPFDRVKGTGWVRREGARHTMSGSQCIQAL